MDKLIISGDRQKTHEEILFNAGARRADWKKNLG